MHARMITFGPREGRFDEVTRVLKERTLGDAQRRPGFLGFVVMCDRAGGKVVSNTYWDTEVDMLSGDASSEYLQDQYSRVVALLRNPPVVGRERTRLGEVSRAARALPQTRRVRLGRAGLAS